MEQKRFKAGGSENYLLYSAPHSLYVGRVRSYLIKNNIQFEEYSIGHDTFRTQIVPVGKLPTIPTLVAPTGEVIRDGAAIIEHFESAVDYPSYPKEPIQQFISVLFDIIGVEGLRRPAMHYRWNFPEDNDDFLRYHFYSLMKANTSDRAVKVESVMEKLRGVTEMRGVSKDTEELVEALYLELLDALNDHFECAPYLLGGRPCIGDFGLIAPLYGHLGRDPYPSQLMKKRAPRVYRWVERMNRFDQDAPEYFDFGTDFFKSDEVPETLLTILRVLSQDFIPETRASANFLNTWLSRENPEEGSSAIFPLGSSLGSIDFQVRGKTITAIVVPYRHFQLQRLHRIYDDFDSIRQKQIGQLLDSCRMKDILSIRLERLIGRHDNLEIWLD
ncbi:MAG: glutathione S-transferase family protein [OM182 bacterium]|uniref:Glutathione S-transferase family protein n=1 Tax=OM182 bacterium TaxID=2510334 RepID=A0A520RYX4_9GAMM|nr:MAG: glutathione S-transferase family protein [OM182 bacterium]